MSLAAVLAAFLLAAQVISLPVTNPTTQDDTKVMKCIAEVISDTVSKPNPIPISQECLEILQGDERIRSILRHQNLLKELQEIAIQGASERTEQQKKSHGFEDELSEVLESQSNTNTERDLLDESPDEDPVASLAELEAEKSQQNRERDGSKEEGNSWGEREPRVRDVESEDDKENGVGFDSNKVSETELPWDDAIDNHIRNNAQDDEVPDQREADEFEEEEKEHAYQHSHEESKEENVREQIEEEEEDEEEEEKDGEEGGDEDEEEEEEKERNTSEEENPLSSEDMEDQREDDNQDTKRFEQDENASGEKEKYHHTKGGRHHSLDETRQDDDSSHVRDTEREEMEEDSSRALEDAKKWNKMDELAKQLTTTKRGEETESSEDPDRSMKLAMSSHKYDFRNSEDNMERPPKHHSKEESSEGGFPLVAMPEEKKDEEGSANRRTEDQDLESLAAIEAELEKVAHKLHALRRG
ncbi:chromogranin-A [Pogona vitticeps]